MWLAQFLLFSLFIVSTANPTSNQNSKRIPNSIPADLSLLGLPSPLYVRSAFPDPEPDHSKKKLFKSTDNGCLKSDYDTCPDNDFYCCPQSYTCDFSTFPPTCNAPKASGLSKGAKIGIAIAVVVILLIIASGIVAFCCLCRAGGKWHKGRNSPAVNAGGTTAYVSPAVHATQMQPLNPAGKEGVPVQQPYNDQTMQTTLQNPYDPPVTHTSYYGPQAQQTTPAQYAYPQYAPPPQSPAQYPQYAPSPLQVPAQYPQHAAAGPQSQGPYQQPIPGQVIANVPQPPPTPAPPYGQHQNYPLVGQGAPIGHPTQ